MGLCACVLLLVCIVGLDLVSTSETYLVVSISDGRGRVLHRDAHFVNPVIHAGVVCTHSTAAFTQHSYSTPLTDAQCSLVYVCRTAQHNILTSPFLALYAHTN